MADKTYQRSIRMSEEVREVVERQVGEGFNQKFENLVRRFACEEKALDDRLVQKRKDLENLNSEISKRRDLVMDFVKLEREQSSVDSEYKALCASISGFRDQLEKVVTQSVELVPAPALESGLQPDEKENVTQSAARGDRSCSKNGLQGKRKQIA